MMDRGPSTQALVEHMGFLRALAQKLVFDEGQAEDVVQDALAVALQNRPRHPARLRAWLARITRNLALNKRRSEHRRAHRERVAARPEGQPATGDVAARLDLHRLVVREVKLLDEPYRTTIVMRFFDDLPPSEIAHRMRVPVKTVDTRLRRGVQLLRVCLDAAHGGDRRAWCLGLVALVPLKESLPLTAAGGSTAALAGAVMSTKATLAVSAACVATFFVGWAVKPDANTPHRRGGRTGRAGGVIARTEYDRVQGELETERRQRMALEKKLTELTAAPGAAPGEATTKEARESGGHGPRFVFEGYEKALNDVDWKVAGEALNAMPPLLAEVLGALENSKPIPPVAAGEIPRHQGPLMTQARKLEAGGLPGTTINGVFTHPVVQVNMIYATLLQAGKPLSGAQQEQLGEVGTSFFELDKQRLAGYHARTMGLQKLIDETALKDRFYRAVDELLTVEQRAILHPPATKDYVGVDFFSSGLVWGQKARTLRFKTRQDLAEQALVKFSTLLRLDDAKRAKALTAFGAWANSMSDDYLAEAATAATRQRMIKTGRVRVAAHAQLQLQHALLTQVGLDEEQHKALLELSVVLVPFRSGSPD
jgi:RNA polymerase sigma-70 factor (ECF subfamily)